MAAARPPVSVLISVLNGASWLREAIDSVLAQTFTDFELLVIDNASHDETPAILAGYDDPRLVVVRNEATLSLAASLNRGLSLARAPLVARLDADDIAKPERLARQQAAMAAAPDLVLLGTWWDDLWDGPAPRIEPGPATATAHEALLDALAGGNPIAHPSIMLRREAALAAGGYPEDFAYAQDYALWLRLARAGRIGVLPERLVVVRHHPGQLSTVQSWSGTRLEDVIRLHRQALTLPGLSERGRAAGRWALAAACYRLAGLRLREHAPTAAAALVLRGLATAPVATLRRALS